MVSVKSYVVSAMETAVALQRLSAQLADRTLAPSMIFTFYDEAHDDALIHRFLGERFPGVPFLGGTSCGGTMSEAGLGEASSLGILLIEDHDGEYGVASTELSGNAADAAESALHAALENAGCAGELPELIWIYQAPGQEEKVISGLRRIVGDRCPIIGGSSADNSVAGRWRQLSPQGVMPNGLVVAVLFTSGGISFAFQGGYEPAGPSGVATKVYSVAGSSGIATRASGRRILTIDDEPAASVYNRWIGGAVAAKLGGGNILMETTMYPLGIHVGRIGEVTHYLVVHPEEILADGAITTFADIEEGSRLFSMRGEKARLIERAGKVAASAVAALPRGSGSLAGGLVVYCAGCRLAVSEQMPKVASTVNHSFGGLPFIGCFTFGEQGQVLGNNAHGNLMISAIAFGR